MAWLRCGLIGLALLAATTLPAASRALAIASGDDWLTTATDPGGLAWTQPGFDDAAWIPAFAPYPNPTQPSSFLPGTTAEYMWYWDAAAQPSGEEGPLEVWFRYEFALAAADFPADGRARVVGDDYFALYANGQLVGEGHHDQCYCAYAVDFTPWLVEGDNVLAIRAFDGFHDGPADRSFEAILFATTDAIVPEPASLALTGGGLAALGAARRRRARRLG
jgi:hypothetical protein